MKKPKHIIRSARALESARLRCATGAALVTLTAPDFERIWKLAKEAEHFNMATRTGT